MSANMQRNDVALSSLVKCLEAVRVIRAHGIVPGPWEDREEWLNDQIHRVWRNRGAFPGAGAALEAIGMRLGTCMVLELLSAGTLKSNEDPGRYSMASCVRRLRRRKHTMRILKPLPAHGMACPRNVGMFSSSCRVLS